MITLIRCLKSDFYKLRHTSILWLHLLIPLAGSFMFLAYYESSSLDVTNKISGYLEALAITFPLLIGLISGLVIDQEEQAGNFQVLLCSTKSKCITYLSKLILLFLFGIFSITLAVGTFALGCQTVPHSLYLKSARTLIMGNIFIYILHVFISLKFGKVASTSLGVVGSLISALMITGLGDKVWHWVPWAWGVRFCDNLVFEWAYPSATTEAVFDTKQGIFIMLFAIGILFFSSLFWFRQWEGRKSYE